MVVIRLQFDSVNFVYTTDWHLTDTPRQVAGPLATARRSWPRPSRDLAFKYSGVGLFGGDTFHARAPARRETLHRHRAA